MTPDLFGRRTPDDPPELPEDARKRRATAMLGKGWTGGPPKAPEAATGPPAAKVCDWCGKPSETRFSSCARGTKECVCAECFAARYGGPGR
jgi:hypothetical protein